MATLKTQPTENDVKEFLNAIDDRQKRKDSFKILGIMKSITGEEPKMWGSSIIGFGQYHYQYESGREGDWFLTGFSPRKKNLSLYIMAGFDNYDDLMSRLGKYKTGKSCLYIKRLEQVDLDILKKLIKESVDYMRAKYN
ncbi:DUF1801 domain-containing protein [Aliifodinibius salicampi]|uniref:DUF1801 domain-containing protein n=1 Tax=Fodinibius salicampi TaxID=1920655 RepID=A0ABT3Q1A0_9BACT|nr:DUF1801 domain-containing protein [Fodinibius salicampi]MCW9713880.1 DUF1801 domain-containing protein [Fodinibius salicampi]